MRIYASTYTHCVSRYTNQFLLLCALFERKQTSQTHYTDVRLHFVYCSRYQNANHYSQSNGNYVLNPGRQLTVLTCLAIGQCYLHRVSDGWLMQNTYLFNSLNRSVTLQNAHVVCTRLAPIINHNHAKLFSQWVNTLSKRNASERHVTLGCITESIQSLITYCRISQSKVLQILQMSLCTQSISTWWTQTVLNTLSYYWDN